MTSRAVTITLELRLAGDEFSGWLGMLVTIDSLLSATDESPPAEAA